MYLTYETTAKGTLQNPYLAIFGDDVEVVACEVDVAAHFFHALLELGKVEAYTHTLSLSLSLSPSLSLSLFLTHSLTHSHTRTRTYTHTRETSLHTYRTRAV